MLLQRVVLVCVKRWFVIISSAWRGKCSNSTICLVVRCSGTPHHLSASLSTLSSHSGHCPYLKHQGVFNRASLSRAQTQVKEPLRQTPQEHVLLAHTTPTPRKSLISLSVWKQFRSMRISVWKQYLPVCQSKHLSLSVVLSFSLSICLSVYLFIYLSVSLSYSFHPS